MAEDKQNGEVKTKQRDKYQQKLNPITEKNKQSIIEIFTKPDKRGTRIFRPQNKLMTLRKGRHPIDNTDRLYVKR